MRDKCVHIRLSRGKAVFELGQFHGQTRLVRLRVRGKDVQNQLGAIEDLDSHRLLQVASLARTQVVVEDHHVRLVRGHQPHEFLDLATPQKCGGVGRLAALRHPAHHPRAGRRGQPLEFLQGILLKSLVGKNDSDQHRGFAGHTLGAFSFVHSGVQPRSRGMGTW